MTIDINNRQAEYMGVFGLSWEEKVATFVKKQLKGTAQAKKLSSFSQPGGLNVSLVKNLYNEYAALMARGYQPVSFSVSPDAAGNGGTISQSSISLAAEIGNKTNVDVAIVLQFLRALFVLSRDGKIPFAKWNPAGWKQSTDLRQSFDTENTGVLSVARSVTKGAAKASGSLLLVAGLAAAAFLLSQLKQFTHR